MEVGVVSRVVVRDFVHADGTVAHGPPYMISSGGIRCLDCEPAEDDRKCVLDAGAYFKDGCLIWSIYGFFDGSAFCPDGENLTRTLLFGPGGTTFLPRATDEQMDFTFACPGDGLPEEEHATWGYPSDNTAWSEYGELCLSGKKQSPIDLPAFDHASV